VDRNKNCLAKLRNGLRYGVSPAADAREHEEKRTGGSQSPLTPRPISKKVRAAIDLLERRGMTITAAAEKVGIARETLSRALGEPHVQEYTQRKRLRNVEVASIRASARTRELLESESNKVAADMVKFNLGVVGIKPAKEVNVNFGPQFGYILDLRSGRDRKPLPPIDVTGRAGVVIEDAPAAPAEIASPADEQRNDG
jgi:hypothetical protein